MGRARFEHGLDGVYMKDGALEDEAVGLRGCIVENVMRTKRGWKQRRKEAKEQMVHSIELKSEG